MKTCYRWRPFTYHITVINMDKERIVSELKRNGIQVILSRPQDLSVNTINKYLEIKAKRMR